MEAVPITYENHCAVTIWYVVNSKVLSVALQTLSEQCMLLPHCASLSLHDQPVQSDKSDSARRYHNCHIAQAVHVGGSNNGFMATLLFINAY